MKSCRLNTSASLKTVKSRKSAQTGVQGRGGRGSREQKKAGGMGRWWPVRGGMQGSLLATALSALVLLLVRAGHEGDRAGGIVAGIRGGGGMREGGTRFGGMQCDSPGAMRRGGALMFPWSRIRGGGGEPVEVVLRGGGGGGGDGNGNGEREEEEEGFREVVEERYREIIRGAGEAGGGGTRFDALGAPPLGGDGDFSIDIERMVKDLPGELVKELGEVMMRGMPKAGPYAAYNEAMMQELQDEIREAGGDDGLDDSGPDDEEAVYALLRQAMRDEMPEDASWADYGAVQGKGRYAASALGYSRDGGKTLDDLKAEDPEAFEESDHVEGERFEVVEGARLEKYLDEGYQDRWYKAACEEFKKNGVGNGPKRFQKKGVKMRKVRFAKGGGVESYSNSDTEEEDEDGRQQQQQQQQQQEQQQQTEQNQVKQEEYQSLNAPVQDEEEERRRYRDAYLSKCVVGSKIDLDALDDSAEGGDEADKPLFVYRLHSESPGSSEDSVDVAERQAMLEAKDGPAVVVDGVSSEEDVDNEALVSSVMKMPENSDRIGGRSRVGLAVAGMGGGGGGGGEEEEEEVGARRKEELMSNYVGMFGIVPPGELKRRKIQLSLDDQLWHAGRECDVAEVMRLMSVGARSNVDFWVVRDADGGTGAGISYRIVGPGEGDATIDSLIEAGPEGLRYAAEVSCAVISRGKLVESSVPVPVPARGAPGWEAAAKECLVELSRDRKISWPFEEPVDPAFAPGYLQEIRTPMDLGTVRKKLSRRQYGSPDSFLSEVRLIWSNAWKYNREGDDIFVMAEKMSEVFEELVVARPILQPEPPAAAASKPVAASVGLRAEGWREYGFVNHTEGRIKRQAVYDARARAKMDSDRALTGQAGYEASHQGGKAKEGSEKAGGSGKLSSAGGGPPSSPVPAKSALGRPSTTSKPKTADETWKRTCGRMLVRLWKQKEVWPFCEPVDYVKEGIPTYPDVIKFPMDLGTVKLKLTNGTYTTAEAFADDVRLTFDNAMAFNPKGHWVHTAAAKLIGIFNEAWAEVAARIESRRTNLGGGLGGIGTPLRL